MHEPSPPSSKSSSGAAFESKIIRRAVRAAAILLLLLGSTLRPGSTEVHQLGVDIYTSEFETAPNVDQYYTERFREEARRQQEQFRVRVAIPNAVSDNVPTLAALAEAKEVKAASQARPASSWQNWCIFGLVTLGSVLIGHRLFPNLVDDIRDWFTPWEAMRGGVLADENKVRVEAQAFADFVAAFHAGPALRKDTVEPLTDFLSRWPKILGDLRRQLTDLQQTADATARRRLLYDLSREMSVVKSETGMPELFPVWQMVCALEGLLKQLGDKVNEVTASTLRTVAGGVDLLGELCRPDLDAKLLTRRPVRLLAVDDDPISQRAISFALKRTLHAPDLANSGEAGLELARQTGYDVIFVDVEMPGMDGFELCTQIRKSGNNSNTPVVFVTSQSDFNARAQSALSGGTDLIAKPFLTFELAVKTLTLVLQNRLRETKTVNPGEANPTIAPARIVTPVKGSSVAVANVPVVRAEPTGSIEAPGEDLVEIATEFLKRAPEHLDWVNELLRDALKLVDENAWSQTLADVYLRLQSFTPAGVFAQGHPALQLSAALERLLRKLLQNQTPPTKGTMMTVSAGIELLQELCTDLAGAGRLQEPVHLLVVDDDPVARRALTGVLQTTFERPVCAENGPAALALTADRVFDVIFLDVQMPGMDGIEVFAHLRCDGSNMTTPVVFVTGRGDIGSTVEVNSRGDCDVVIKPFVPGELLVKTLTLVMRHRREQSMARNQSEDLVAAGSC